MKAVANRLATAIGTLLGVSAVLFAAGELAPGDAARARLGINAPAQSVAVLRRQLGLDQPVGVRYLHWLAGALRGDFGVSVQSGRPVLPSLVEPLAASALLAMVAAVLAAVLALGFGAVAGLAPGRPRDLVVSGFALLLVSVPPFVVATGLVIVFAVTLRVLPAATIVPAGRTVLDVPEVLVLPAVTLALFAGGWTSRMVRAEVAEIAASPHVAAARLAGLSEPRVLARHILPCAAGPLLQVAAWVLSVLIGGSVVVEVVFSYPGLGWQLVSAVKAHDAPVLEAAGLIVAATTVAAFLLAELVASILDPRGGAA